MFRESTCQFRSSSRFGSACAWGAVLCCLGATLTGCGRPYHRQEQLTLLAPLPAEKLVVRNGFGDVFITADPDATEVHAEITRIARGATSGDADAALGEIEVCLAPQEGQPGVLLASADHPQATASRAYEVEWRLTAPPHVPIDVQTDFGDVEARGFVGGTTLDSAFGDIEVEAAGEINVHTNFGDVDLRVLADSPRDVRASTAFGDVEAQLPANRTGRVMVRTAFGSLNVRLEGMTIHLLRQRGQHFEAELAGSVEPTMELTTRFGDVSVRCYPVPQRDTPEP